MIMEIVDRMTDVITYKGKIELDAIAAWCKDHTPALDFLRSLFAPDSKVVKEALQTTFRKELNTIRAKIEEPDLLDNLDPDSSWEDARDYMAHLVCYVWNNFEACNSNGKAAEYVFRIAREGCRLYADCRYARTLLAKYGTQISTISKEARILHACGTHFKKRKWSGMEKPSTWAQEVKASKAAEDRQIKMERRSGRC